MLDINFSNPPAVAENENIDLPPPPPTPFGEP